MIADAHTHLGVGAPYYGKSKNWAFEGEFGGADLLSLMDEVGVQHAVCFPMGTKNSQRGQQLVIEAVQAYPDRITGFYWGNPWRMGVVEEFEKHVQDYGLRGLKLHPTSDAWPADNPVINPLIEKAIELGVPVTIHSHQPGSRPTLIGELANRFPEATIIMAHMGMHNYKDAIYVAERQPNIILETSVQPWIHRIARMVVDRIGAERLVFGSDAPLHHPLVELTKIRVSALTDEERALVLGRNILRLVGRVVE